MWEHLSQVPLCQFLQTDAWLDTPPNTKSLKDHFYLLHHDGASLAWVDGHAQRTAYGQLKRPAFSCQKSVYSKKVSVFVLGQR
jgi:hypothetical protein